MNMVLVLSLSLCVLCSFTVSKVFDVGKCKDVKSEVPDDFLDKMFKEENGIWNYKLISETDENKKISWMTLKITSAHPEKGYYWQTTYQTLGYKTYSEYTDHIYENSDGELISNSKNGDEGKQGVIKILQYKEGDFCMFYKCDENDGDEFGDLMFVLAHSGKGFPDTRKPEMEDLRDKKHLSGALWYIY